MPERRKPPVEKSSRSGNRHDAATMPADSPGFSIETTTMRLKSLRLRRADAAQIATRQADQPDSRRATVLRAACVTTSVACGVGLGGGHG